MPRDAATVSKNMSKIHSKDTSIELQLRKALWHKGYRYRKNYKALPGSPDIVLTKYKIAIFCDSEFFHGKDWEYLKLRLEKGHNPDYWIKKIERNRNRDWKTTKNYFFSDTLSFISGDRISKNILTSVSKLLRKLSGTAKWHPSMMIHTIFHNALLQQTGSCLPPVVYLAPLSIFRLFARFCSISACSILFSFLTPVLPGYNLPAFPSALYSHSKVPLHAL